QAGFTKTKSRRNGRKHAECQKCHICLSAQVAWVKCQKCHTPYRCGTGTNHRRKGTTRMIIETQNDSEANQVFARANAGEFRILSMSRVRCHNAALVFIVSEPSVQGEFVVVRSDAAGAIPSVSRNLFRTPALAGTARRAHRASHHDFPF